MRGMNLADVGMDVGVRLATVWPRLRLDVSGLAPTWVHADTGDLMVAMRRSLLGFCTADVAGLASAATAWVAVHADDALMSITLEHDGRTIPDDEWTTLWLPTLRDEPEFAASDSDRGGLAALSGLGDMLDLARLRAAGGDMSIGLADTTSVIVAGRTSKDPTRIADGVS